MGQPPQNPYRTLYFLVKHGDWGANLVSLGVLLAAGVGAVIVDALWALPLVVLGAGLLLVILRSYVELVRVIVDMLLPK